MSAKKELIILRGLPGSGKTYLANKLVKLHNASVFSADSFFRLNAKGTYRYDAKLVPRAHTWNLRRVEKALSEGKHMVVIDNTCIKPSDARPYVELGLKFGYEIIFREPDTAWQYDPEECYLRNRHNVPREAIKKMAARWHPNLTLEQVLPKSKIDEILGDKNMER